jgi:hypothetical protein
MLLERPRLEDPPPTPKSTGRFAKRCEYTTDESKAFVRRKPGQWFIVAVFSDHNDAYSCLRAWRGAQFEACTRRCQQTLRTRVYARWVEE